MTEYVVQMKEEVAEKYRKTPTSSEFNSLRKTLHETGAELQYTGVKGFFNLVSAKSIPLKKSDAEKALRRMRERDFSTIIDSAYSKPSAKIPH